MCKKSFTLATFVRHSISTLPENYYSFHPDIIEHQIANGKGFFAYMPVIKRIFRVNSLHIDMSRVYYKTKEITSQGILAAGYPATVIMGKSWDSFEVSIYFIGDIFQQTFQHIHKDLLS
jgi:hypothetical protein